MHSKPKNSNKSRPKTILWNHIHTINQFHDFFLWIYSIKIIIIPSENGKYPPKKFRKIDSPGYSLNFLAHSDLVEKVTGDFFFWKIIIILNCRHFLIFSKFFVKFCHTTNCTTCDCCIKLWCLFRQAKTKTWVCI